MTGAVNLIELFKGGGGVVGAIGFNSSFFLTSALGRSDNCVTSVTVKSSTFSGVIIRIKEGSEKPTTATINIISIATLCRFEEVIRKSYAP